MSKLHDCKRGLATATPQDYNRWWRHIKALEQLANEMQESKVCPFPDGDRNKGWAAARRFYAIELRAILDRTTAKEPAE
jgi:hypothetical protein